MKDALEQILPGSRQPSGIASATNPLPSWNEGPAKRNILDFVAAVTLEGSPSYVPVPERIATFDNDGTLWAAVAMLMQERRGISVLPRRREPGCGRRQFGDRTRGRVIGK